MQLTKTNIMEIPQKGPSRKSPKINSRSHKIMVAKRYDARLLVSTLLTHYHKLSHPLRPEMIHQQIGFAAIQNVQKLCLQHEMSEPSTKANKKKADEGFKYLNAQKYMPTNIDRVQELRLDHVSPQRVLDLGSGAGYFLFIAQQFGHDCLGLDTGDVKVYSEMMQMLGLKRVSWRINPFEPLPDLGAPFDIITSYQMLFNRLETCTNGRKDKWGPMHWDFFLRDIYTHLKPNGTILLRFNQEGKHQYITPKLAEYFRSVDGQVRRTSVRFDLKNGQLSQHRPNVH